MGVQPAQAMRVVALPALRKRPNPFLRIVRVRATWFALGILAVFFIAAILAPLVAPYDPLKTDLLGRLAPPSARHWFGQDEVGRDIFSRIVYGGRVSLSVGILSVSLGVLLGGLLGTIAGFWRKADGLIMRFVDVLLAFPFVLRALAVVAILGAGYVNLLLAIGLGRVPAFARLARSVVVSIREEPYVEAAQAAGASDLRVLVRHVLPQMVAPMVTLGTLELGTAILGAATLSFLGLGVIPPTAEWGAIASTGRQYLREAPHLVFFPSIAIFLVVWSFNVLGDVLRDVLDPKVRS